MPIVLALVAAIAYGLSDFVGGVLAKRISAWTIALVASVTGAAFIAGLALVTDGSPTPTDFAWALVAGVGNGLGTAFLYRGLSAGRMAVVSPVSGVGAALLPVAVGVLTGERPGPLVWIGILAALPAIWLVSREPARDSLAEAAREPGGTGLLDGLLAGVGFGTLFAALAQIPEEAGFFPLALNQVIAAALILAIATAVREPWLPRSRRALTAMTCGALGALATGAFLVATQGGLLTVTAVIASLYPGVTVLLAAALLREHIHRLQGLGLALCAVTVVLVAAG